MPRFFKYQTKYICCLKAMSGPKAFRPKPLGPNTLLGFFSLLSVLTKPFSEMVPTFAKSSGV